MRSLVGQGEALGEGGVAEMGLCFSMSDLLPRLAEPFHFVEREATAVSQVELRRHQMGMMVSLDRKRGH